METSAVSTPVERLMAGSTWWHALGEEGHRRQY